VRRPLAELARAKVNLTLRVVGVRADGYHDINSLVVFAHQGDRLALTPDKSLSLSVHGPYGKAAGKLRDNLVLKASHALAARIDGLRLGRFRLDKRLPVAAGLGGGSADAAAALRLLARANKLKSDDPRLLEAARATGADVPVCLEQCPRVMRGIGEQLSEPYALPKLHAVLVNPGRGLATKDVFAAFDRQPVSRSRAAPVARLAPGRVATSRLVSVLAEECNDLEGAAIALLPVIADVLAALRERSHCLLARMSGAGATCFGLFATAQAAATAARSLRAQHPNWWVRADTFGA
jgi:4-diphosphocytidyl-2-C-methyl-D-erythritol kinase